MGKDSLTQDQWLRSLIADWQLIADVAFSDLVLWIPKKGKLQADAIARPVFSATLFYRDVSGPVDRYEWADLISEAWTTGKIVTPLESQEPQGVNTRVSAYPVFAPTASSGDSPIAVISRHTNLGESKRPTKFQQNFMACADELLEMVSKGLFPSPEAGSASKRGAPRASDGLLRLDSDGKVSYASPNAVSMLNRAGVFGDIEGEFLAESVTAASTHLLQADEGLPLILTGKGAWRSDLLLGTQTLSLRSIPIFHEEKRTGAIVLCRDVSELRVREQELITKDVTIREIHHRVKNNLQTVASLLRLQSRQAESQEVKDSLSQAMRRVSAIAVVHDVLSEGIDQEVSFDLIFKRILALIPDIAGYHTTVKTELVGSFGELPAERSTPLALVLTEVVANAVEHGLGDRSGTITVEASRDKQHLLIEVTDDGSGLPEGKVGTGLGTQIIRTLVESELRGKINWTSPIRGGTRVSIELPL